MTDEILSGRINNLDINPWPYQFEADNRDFLSNLEIENNLVAGFGNMSRVIMNYQNLNNIIHTCSKRINVNN